MNFKPTKWKVVFSFVIAVSITLITNAFLLPLPTLEQLEQTEGILRTAMIRLPKPIVLLYLLILLIIYYTSIYIIWSLIESSRSKSRNKGIKISKKKK